MDAYVFITYTLGIFLVTGLTVGMVYGLGAFGQAVIGHEERRVRRKYARQRCHCARCSTDLFDFIDRAW